ncbi:hypothetical protein AC249_AIPGENE6894 [Exaiptasia diaphana]|nr:hypothetical protein AC249_AIPGENE6894 [Exaiptasia diaphana]
MIMDLVDDSAFCEFRNKREVADRSKIGKDKFCIRFFEPWLNVSMFPAIRKAPRLEREIYHSRNFLYKVGYKVFLEFCSSPLPFCTPFFIFSCYDSLVKPRSPNSDNDGGSPSRC